MNTRLLNGQDGIAEAARLLRAGEIVALPTETVYGLAGHALDPRAVARIFEAKERPHFDPLIVHLPAPEWLDRLTLAAGDPLVRALAGRFWPGPLTMVLPRRSLVPDLVTAGLPGVAVRMPAHPVFIAVLESLGSPVAAPSANRFGRISPTAASHVVEELQGRIPLVLDGGPCAVGIESTIVAPRDGSLHILRAGPVGVAELEAFAPVCHPAPGGSIEAPGQLPAHYAPRAPLRLLDGDASGWPEPARAGLLAWSRPLPGFAVCEVLTPRGDAREAAANLFAAMRRLDAAGVDLIVAEPPPATGLGLAILDRLRRASAQ